MTSKVACSFEELIYNEACVSVKNENVDFSVWLYELSTDCVLCPYKLIGNVDEIAQVGLKVFTAKSFNWRIFRHEHPFDSISAQNTSNLHCEVQPHVDDFGLYNLTIDKIGCNVTTVVKPINSFLPLYITIGILVITLSLLSLCRIFIRSIKKSCSTKRDEAPKQISHKRRINSIDTVRGISILVMIFVNDGAGGYPTLLHATWNGLLMGDLVFPCFMWIMGLCIPLSLSSQLSRGVSRLTICLSIIKRSILLFLLGISLNTLGTDARLENIRIFGVLQRFSIAYIITALMYTSKIHRKPRKYLGSIKQIFADIYSLFVQWIVAFLIIAVHCFITFDFSVPNCPRGYTGPGGSHFDGKYAGCTGGAAGYIDRLLLGPSHVYQFPGIVTVYGSQPFDPEGILGCLTSIFQTFLGVQAGEILLRYKDWRNRVIRWLFWALMLGFIGSYLHFRDIIPVNKHLWSISFVCVTTCFCLTLFTVCYLLIDVAKVWRGGPFRIPGMNALVMYIGHEMCYQIFPFHWKTRQMNTHSWLLAESLWGVIMWIIIAYVLHHKKIYINI